MTSVGGRSGALWGWTTTQGGRSPPELRRRAEALLEVLELA